MKKTLKRFISIALVLAVVSGLLPVTEIKVMADSDGVVSISNDYISVTVSSENGGFFVKTREGDKLIK